MLPYLTRQELSPGGGWHCFCNAYAPQCFIGSTLQARRYWCTGAYSRVELLSGVYVWQERLMR